MQYFDDRHSTAKLVHFQDMHSDALSIQINVTAEKQ